MARKEGRCYSSSTTAPINCSAALQDTLVIGRSSGCNTRPDRKDHQSPAKCHEGRAKSTREGVESARKPPRIWDFTDGNCSLTCWNGAPGKTTCKPQEASRSCASSWGKNPPSRHVVNAADAAEPHARSAHDGPMTQHLGSTDGTQTTAHSAFEVAVRHGHDQHRPGRLWPRETRAQLPAERAVHVKGLRTCPSRQPSPTI